MHRIVAKFVPRLMSQDQKDNYVIIYQELLNQVNSDEIIMKQILTGDETWVYGYDVDIKVQ